MKLIDLTKQSMGWNNPWETRTTSQIRNIGIHHSATTTGSQTVFENHWRTFGWRNGGYSEIILPNGNVEICYVPTTVTNGVSGNNTSTYHICVVGDFRTNGAQPSAAQSQALFERIRFNVNRFSNVTFDRVFGHNEFSGHASNICPGQNMNNIRRDARQAPTPTPANNASTHTVRSGENLSGIAQHYNTTVAELQRLNSIANANLIKIGQVLRLPSGSSANKPTVTELARQVIAGQWGNGADRQRRLTAAGHNAAAVQAEVNRLLR